VLSVIALVCADPHRVGQRSPVKPVEVGLNFAGGDKPDDTKRGDTIRHGVR